MKNAILNNFQKVVTPQFISQSAVKHKFCQRSTSQIHGLEFMRMLIAHAGSGFEMSYSGLNATLQGIKPKINISNQALAKYFYKKAAVDLVRSVYEKIFAYQKEKMLELLPKVDLNILTTFNRVLVQDSTVCNLNQKLAFHYKGSGGDASKSSLKVDVIHEIKTSTILKIGISAGISPDVSKSISILDEAQKHDLVLRDMGYSKLDIFAEMKNREIYFISRLTKSSHVYLKNNSLDPIDLGRYLKQKHKNFNIIDVSVYIGVEREQYRLIAYKVPPEIAAKRRRLAKRNAVCRGNTASKNNLNLCDYVILITNIPLNMAEACFIGTIYRIRWNIELLFKTWKSQLNLQHNLLRGYRQTRIECFVYIILIIGLMTILINGWLKKLDANFEVSLERLSKWLVNRNGYYYLLFGSVRELKNMLQSDLRGIKCQKRKRKTTRERILSREEYSEKFCVF